jgi:hypothetical protein
VKVVTSPAATPSAPHFQELTGYSPMDCTGGTCACNALVNGASTVTTVFVPAMRCQRRRGVRWWTAPTT